MRYFKCLHLDLFVHHKKDNKRQRLWKTNTLKDKDNKRQKQQKTKTTNDKIVKDKDKTLHYCNIALGEDSLWKLWQQWFLCFLIKSCWRYGEPCAGRGIECAGRCCHFGDRESEGKLRSCSWKAILMNLWITLTHSIWVNSIQFNLQIRNFGNGSYWRLWLLSTTLGLTISIVQLSMFGLYCCRPVFTNILAGSRLEGHPGGGEGSMGPRWLRFNCLSCQREFEAAR